MRRLHAVKSRSIDDKSYSVAQDHAVWVFPVVLLGPQDLCFCHQTVGTALQYSVQVHIAAEGDKSTTPS